jgi:hypothetical protein
VNPSVDKPAPPSTSPESTGQSFLKTIDRILYPIVFGFTVVILCFQVYEFWKGGAYQPRYPAAQVYLTLLTAYAAQREGGKWLGANEVMARARRGELFVGLWFALYLAIWAIANLSSRWVMPQELQAITLGVLAVFVGTGVSSGLRQRSSRSEAQGKESDRRMLILRMVAEKGPINAEAVAQELGVVRSTAWRALEALVKEGRVVQEQAANTHDRLYRMKE